MNLWRDIPSVPGYEASLEGQIRNKRTGRTRTPYAGKTVGFGPVVGTKIVSRLVCEAFLGPQPEGKPHVAHADGNPTNNGPFNLYWASPKENEADKHIHGTWWKRASGTILSGETVDKIKHEIVSLPRTPKGQLPKGACKLLAEKYGTSGLNMSAIGRGVSWKEGVSLP